jgi:hypothetical protein
VVAPLCEETGAGCANALARGRDDSYWCRRHRWKYRGGFRRLTR